MATAKEEGDLWGARAQDWARSSEPAWHDVFTAVLDQAKIGKGMRHLDIGCGAGGALVLARERGAHVTGFDAAEALAILARERLPGAKVLVGDMEDLPFIDQSFDAVTGINSFQFAGDQRQALAEAARVTRPGGSVTLLVWGPRDKCDLLSEVMAHIVALLPPRPPVPSLPLAARAEELMREVGLEPEISGDITATLTYPDHATAVKAILSASESSIRQVGERLVREKAEKALTPFKGKDGTVRLRNMFRLITARRRNS
jgi:SAM-dependent methyltransferase